MMTDKRIPVLIFLVLFIFAGFQASAQKHLSVPITDQVYHLLETAQLRGLIDPLPSVKPYSVKMVDHALNQLRLKGSRLTPREKTILDSFLEERYRERPWWEAGEIYAESETMSAVMGLYIDGKYSIALTESRDEPYQGFISFLNTYLDGSLGKTDPVLSYRFAMDFGVHQVENTSESTSKEKKPSTITQFAAFTPYTFTKPWDGYRYKLFDLFNHGSGENNPVYLGFRMTPEIAAELYDESVRVSFSRTPRNWGLGDDSIILSGQARPFLGIEVHAKVFSWMDYSVLVGTLENDGTSREGGSLYQAMVTMKNVDMRPFPWLYIGIHEGVVWPKRFELGYINPLIFSSLYQGMGGDFDNIIGGVTLGGRIPGYAEFYGTWYIDELSPVSFSDFFDRVRNLFSLQGGIRTVVPGLSFGSLLLQYTKIEPFAYTHPPTSNPWVQPYKGDEPYQSFISDEYGISSRLDPNSDELLLKLKFMPASRMFLTAGYQLIRHGHYGGFYDMPLKSYKDGDGILPDGMDYPDWLPGDDKAVGNLWKSFLKDGPYEWYHIAAVTGEFNLSGLLPVPVRMGLTYSYTYQYMNDETGERITESSEIKKTLRPDFQVGSRNTFTVEFRVF